MKISEKLLWFGLRSCLYCGSLDRGSDGFCKLCSKDLWSWQKEGGGLYESEIDGLQVLSLYEWIPGAQETLSRLVRVLKGPRGRKLWQFYATEYLKQRTLSGLTITDKPMVLIPAPGRNLKKDHARHFADMLGEEGLRMEILPCLSRRGAVASQKKRSRAQRQKVTLHLAENFTLREFLIKSEGKTVVFVDDIVTTGATAKAAWRALGKPRDFAVWALAQRGLSCGASKDLL